MPSKLYSLKLQSKLYIVITPGIFEKLKTTEKGLRQPWRILHSKPYCVSLFAKLCASSIRLFCSYSQQTRVETLTEQATEKSFSTQLQW